MRLGEGELGYLLCGSREILGGKTAGTSGKTDERCPVGNPAVFRSKLRRDFCRFSPGFHRLPLSQISQISLISPAATLNPNTANRSIKAEARKKENCGTRLSK